MRGVSGGSLILASIFLIIIGLLLRSGIVEAILSVIGILMVIVGVVLAIVGVLQVFTGRGRR